MSLTTYVWRRVLNVEVIRENFCTDTSRFDLKVNDVSYSVVLHHMYSSELCRLLSHPTVHRCSSRTSLFLLRWQRKVRYNFSKIRITNKYYSLILVHNTDCFYRCDTKRYDVVLNPFFLFSVRDTSSFIIFTQS